MVNRIDPDVHFHLRTGFAPDLAELDRQRRMGRSAYLEEQLHPERIADPEAERRLARLPMLQLSTREIARTENGDQRALNDLTRAFLIRAAHSKRRLAARMAVFWAQHFYVPAEAAGEHLADYLRTLERLALGDFRSLLFAAARHPAMLGYLDNVSNVKEHPNENYARELLELHTLGVDGGYTERDVKEAARALTGWTTHERTEGGFYFDPGVHDTGAKRVLGHTFPAGRGLEDGLALLDLLARHPSTARFVSYKLARYFVSDDPPPELVERMARTFAEHRGAVRPVLRALLSAPEFYAAAGLRLRSPLEFLAAALATSGTRVPGAWTLWELQNELGQTFMGWRTPDGPPTEAVGWSGTGGLLARWRVALRLTQEADADPEGAWGLVAHLEERTPRAATVGEAVRALARRVLGRLPGPEQLARLVDYAADGGGADTPWTPIRAGRKRGGLFALLIASPEFQWV